MSTDIKLTLSLDASKVKKELRALRKQSDANSVGFQKLQKRTERLEKRFDKTKGKVRTLGLAMRDLRRITQTVRAAVIGFGAALVFRQVEAFAGSIIQAQTSIDKMRNSFLAATNSQAEATAAFERAVGTAKELGVGIEQAGLQMARMAAAGVNAGLTLGQAEEAFTAIGKASVAVGLSADETRLALMAVEQMMSKGKVSAEELRRQLGERIPGAFGLAAQAMGVTTAEFDKMLRTGQVMAEDFLPKFAKVMDERFSGAFEQAQKQMQFAITNMKNQFFEIRVEMAEKLEPAFKNVIRATSDFLERMRQSGDLASFVQFVQRASDALAAWLDSSSSVDFANDLLRALVAIGDTAAGVADIFFANGTFLDDTRSRVARLTVALVSLNAAGLIPTLKTLTSLTGILGAALAAALLLNTAIRQQQRDLAAQTQVLVQGSDANLMYLEGMDAASEALMENSIAAKEASIAQLQLGISALEAAENVKQAAIDQHMADILEAADKTPNFDWATDLVRNKKLAEAVHEMEQLGLEISRIQGRSKEMQTVIDTLKQQIAGMGGEAEETAEGLGKMGTELEKLLQNNIGLEAALEAVENGMDPRVADVYARAIADGANATEALALASEALRGIKLKDELKALAETIGDIDGNETFTEFSDTMQFAAMHAESMKGALIELKEPIDVAAMAAAALEGNLKKVIAEDNRTFFRDMFEMGLISAERLVAVLDLGDDAVIAMGESLRESLAVIDELQFKAEEFIGQFSDLLADSIADALKTGEFSFKDFFRNVMNMLIDFLVKWLAEWIAKILAREAAALASEARIAAAQAATSSASTAGTASTAATGATGATGAAGGISAGTLSTLGIVAVGVLIAVKIWQSNVNKAKLETWDTVATMESMGGAMVTSVTAFKKKAGEAAKFMDDVANLLHESTGVNLADVQERIEIERNAYTGMFRVMVDGVAIAGGKTFGEAVMKGLAQAITQSDARESLGSAMRAVLDNMRTAIDLTEEDFQRRLQIAMEIDNIGLSDSEKAIKQLKIQIRSFTQEALDAGVAIADVAKWTGAQFANMKQSIERDLGIIAELNPFDAAIERAKEYNALLAEEKRMREASIAALEDQIEAELEAIGGSEDVSEVLRDQVRNALRDIGFGFDETMKAMDIMASNLESMVVHSSDAATQAALTLIATLMEQMQLAQAELEELGDPIDISKARRRGSGRGGRGSSGQNPREVLDGMMDSLMGMAGIQEMQFQSVLDHTAEMREHVSKMRLSEEERLALNEQILELERQALDQSALGLAERIAQFTGDSGLADSLAKQRLELEKALLQAEVEAFLLVEGLSKEARANLEAARNALQNSGPSDTTRAAWDSVIQGLGTSFDQLLVDWDEFWNAGKAAMDAGTLTWTEWRNFLNKFRDSAKLAVLDLISRVREFLGLESETTEHTRMRFNIEKALLVAEIHAAKAVLAALGGFQDLIAELDGYIGDLLNLEFTPPPPPDPPDFGDDLQDQTDQLVDALDGLSDFMHSLLVGDQSPLSPQDQFNTLFSRYQQLVQQAAGGDIDSINELQNLIPQLLGAAQGLFGGTATTAYASLFSTIIGDLAAITGDPNPMLSLGIGGAGLSLNDAFTEFRDDTLEQQAAIAQNAELQRQSQFNEQKRAADALVDIRDALDVPPGEGSGVGT